MYFEQFLLSDAFVENESVNGISQDLSAKQLTHWPLEDFNKILKTIFKPILVTDGCDI